MSNYQAHKIFTCLLAWYNENLKCKVRLYFQTVELNLYLAIVMFFYVLFLNKISKVLRPRKDEVTLIDHQLFKFSCVDY